MNDHCPENFDSTLDGARKIYVMFVLTTEFLDVRLFQVRNPTNVLTATRLSPNRPTSSPTVASTRGSNPSHARDVGEPSSAKWTCDATRRRSTRRRPPDCCTALLTAFLQTPSWKWTRVLQDRVAMMALVVAVEAVLMGVHARWWMLSAWKLTPQRKWSATLSWRTRTMKTSRSALGWERNPSL